MNKYYQPSLEEFHIGFRYEIMFPNEKYVSATFGEKITQPLLLQYRDDLMKIAHAVTRTKTLDKSDIEELGWKEESKNFYKIVDGHYDKEEDDTGTEYRLTVKNNFIFIEFYQINFGEPSVPYRGADYKFRGTIKNYNELKTLMKQLNIKQ